MRDPVQSAAPPVPLASSGKPCEPGRLDRTPPQLFFLVSAVFHYLGPSFAVLLFARIDVLGVAWLRIASAAVVFAAWRRPWRLVTRLDRSGRWRLLHLGCVLAAMNSVFYLAVARLPLSTVGAIEFLGTVTLAALGATTRRNAAALVLTTAGVAAITEIRITGQPLGFVFAFANCGLFMLYVILGHRIANSARESKTTCGGGGTGHHGTGHHGTGHHDSGHHDSGQVPGNGSVNGIDQLGASMLIAAVAAAPIGLGGAVPAFTHPAWLLAGIGVGVSSSVVAYVTDQLAMARLPRATFALMLALLPMFATVIGAAVLRQVPTIQDVAGIALVIGGVALHHSPTRGAT